jgi:glycosyltransferase involved in cell wall biosynthesis
MPENPVFSVIIPTYNREHFIKNAIESVLKQTFQNFEIIVVDDGSSDNTRQVLASIQDDRIHYFYKENGERAAARNFGAKKALGSYITFLDSDDWLKSNHFSEAEKFRQLNPEAKIFSLGYDVITPDGARLFPWKRLPNPVNEKLIEGNVLSCMGVFVRKEIFLKNLFNEDRNLSGSEDYELWMRMASQYPIYTVPISTACLVDHEARSVVIFSSRQLLQRIALLKKCLHDDPNVKLKYSRNFNKMNAYLDLYTALHLAMASSKKSAIQKLFQVASQYFPAVLSYRFLVVIKKIIMN